MSEIKNINIGILSGGKSSRMGQDKAGLMINGQSFLEAMTVRLSAVKECSKVIISAGHYGMYDTGSLSADMIIEQVTDRKEGFGPLEGLHQILAASDEEWSFITAIDLPYVTADYVSYMLGNISEEYDAIIPVYDGRKHPLCGFCSRKCIPQIEELIEDDIHKVMLLFERINVRYIDVPDRYREVFTNVNTPEKYKVLLEK